MLGTVINVHHRLLSWLSREVTELCPGEDALAGGWQNRAEQFQCHDQSIQSRLHECIVPSSPLALSSRAKHYTSSLSIHTNIIAAIITEEFPRSSVLLAFLRSRRSLMKSSPSPTIPFLSKSLPKQSQITHALKNILLRILSSKLSATDTSSLATTSSHHKTLTTRFKSSRQQKKSFWTSLRQHPRTKLVELCFPFKAHVDSTRPRLLLCESNRARFRQSRS